MYLLQWDKHSIVHYSNTPKKYLHTKNDIYVFINDLLNSDYEILIFRLILILLVNASYSKIKK